MLLLGFLGGCLNHGSLKMNTLEFGPGIAPKLKWKVHMVDGHSGWSQCT
jgi:hypothetical protein